MSRRARPNKVKKILKNLRRTFDDGQYYEGEQMLKTIHARLMNQNDFDQASQLLSAGAMTLFEHKQIAAGIEIVGDLIETWTKAGNETIDGTKADTLTKLYNLIDENEIENKMDFMQVINNWVKSVKNENQSKYSNNSKSSENEEKKSENNKNRGSAGSTGSTVNYYKFCRENIEIDNALKPLYKAHGISLMKLKFYSLASVAFTKAKNVERQMKLVEEWSNASTMNRLDKEKEYHFLICKIVIQYLMFGAVAQARQFVTLAVDEKKSASQRHPLENFVNLLVESIEKKSIQLYQIVCRTYFPLLTMDQQLMAFMTKVGDVCLGVPPPRQSGGLLGNIMSMFT